MKTAILATLITLLCVWVQATPFFIGAYSQYDLPTTSGNHNTLKTKLLEGGYNATTITISNDDLSNLSDVLQTFGSEVKTILSDQYWAPSLEKVGIHGVTYGNYLKKVKKVTLADVWMASSDRVACRKCKLRFWQVIWSKRSPSTLP